MNGVGINGWGGDEVGMGVDGVGWGVVEVEVRTSWNVFAELRTCEYLSILRIYSLHRLHST